jgi:hypothetical protein
MPRLKSNLALTAALTVGAISGCSNESPTIEQNAQIIGFAQGVDATIVEDQWVQYYDQPYLPGGTLRSVNSGRKFAGCVAVRDEWGSWNLDDGDCFFWGCSAGDNQHCEARYDPAYDYEQLEEVIVEECPAPMARREFKSDEVARYEECIARADIGQTVRLVSRFLIWIRTRNPEYNEEKIDESKPEPEFLVAPIELDTPEQWARIQRDTPVTAFIRGGAIIDGEPDF